MKLDHARIQQLVPHAGTMCLLDAVTDWSDTHIRCTSLQPQPHHPLARAGALPAIAAAEYAAQATAVHGALLDGGGAPRAGMLASLIDMDLHVTNFPEGGGALAINTQLLSRSDAGCLYSFHVADAKREIAAGRLIVAFAKETA